METFWRIVDSILFPMLVTRNAHDYAVARPMHLVERSGANLWFPTSLASRKVQQIGRDPKVTVLFIRNRDFNYASISGQASIIHDKDKRCALWRDQWAEDWPEGPTDRDFRLIKVVGQRGWYHHGGTDETREFSFVEGSS